MTLRVERLEPRLYLSGTADTMPALNEVGGAMAAYGLRRLSNAYEGGAIQVRRTTDGAMRDIGFTSAGSLDTSTLANFSQGGNCYVTIWYDQSGRHADLKQGAGASQPMIVSNGKVLADDQGHARLYFTTDVLAGSGVAMSNQNLTAFFVQEAVYSDSSKVLLGLGKPNYAYLQYSVNDTTGSVWVGDGSTYKNLGDVNTTLQPGWRTIQVLDIHGQTIQYYRNNSLMGTQKHSKAAAKTSALQVGPYSGYISEILVYPALSATNRQKVYNDVNGYHQTGPANSSAKALLPQDWQYQVDLYNWLKKIRVADVTTAPANLQWDGAYKSMAQLEKLWLGMSGGTTEYASASQIVRANPRWFVLNDGKGGGIEGSGTVRVFRSAAEAAFWYTQDLTLANGKQGNPYYHNRALAVRGLVSIAVDMMMTDQLQDDSPGYWSASDFAGGSLLGWLWAYDEMKGVLGPQARQAFEAGFKQMAWKILQWGAHDINGNMDTKAVAAMARLYETVDDPQTKDWALRAARKLLFGSETGTPGTTNYQAGLYRKAGYIDEGDSPETTYNGVSLYYLLEARSLTANASAWDFLDTVVKSMLQFKSYQYFPDPDGTYVGPSGYAGRTGGDYTEDQRDKLWRDVTAAAAFSEAVPFAPAIPDAAGMKSGVKSAVAWFNNRAIGSKSTQTAPAWKESHWPEDNLYFPASGWQKTLRSLQQNDDAKTLYPYEKSSSFNRSFNNEFWAYKAGSGASEYGFFVESLADPGCYNGWYGGSLQTFWSEKTGTVILSQHDKAGSSAASNENTRVWSEIGTWGANHVWGRDENGRAFSSAATSAMAHSVTYAIGAATPYVQETTVLGGTANKGEQTGAEIQGSVTLTNRFEAVSGGVRVTHTLATNQKDQAKELWATIPVYLRDADQKMADTTIEYWNGSKWVALGTTMARSQYLRLGRNFGNGPQYAYIQFTQAQGVKLSSAVWQQSYQDNTRLRNIQVDMLGSSGKAVTLPASKQLQYTIHVDPGKLPAAAVATAGATAASLQTTASLLASPIQATAEKTAVPASTDVADASTAVESGVAPVIADTVDLASTAEADGDEASGVQTAPEAAAVDAVFASPSSDLLSHLKVLAS